MLTTLLLSFGIPMLLGGDEFGRTQQGNNNAYCQDNEITWFDWSQPDTGLLDFTTRLIALRKAHPVFRRTRFLAGAEAAELRWFTPAGTEMTAANWSDASALAIALYLDGSDAPDRTADGTWLVDDDFLVLVNAWWEPLEFVLPVTRQRQCGKSRSTPTVRRLRPDREPLPVRPATASPSAHVPSSCSRPRAASWRSDRCGRSTGREPHSAEAPQTQSIGRTTPLPSTLSSCCADRSADEYPPTGLAVAGWPLTAATEDHDFACPAHHHRLRRPLPPRDLLERGHWVSGGSK
jgi:hypothetical protein